MRDGQANAARARREGIGGVIHHAVMLNQFKLFCTRQQVGINDAKTKTLVLHHEDVSVGDLREQFIAARASGDRQIRCQCALERIYADRRLGKGGDFHTVNCEGGKRKV